MKRLQQHRLLKGYRLALGDQGYLKASAYAEFLNNTKVSLCLPGNSSSETFRYYESLKSGCITVTPKLPSNALYADHPGIQLERIDDADALAQVLRPLLEHSERHDNLQARARAVWATQYSPQAVAAMISDTLAGRTKGS